MEITIRRGTMINALQLVAAAVDVQSGIPILQSARLRASGGRFVMEGSDLDMTARVEGACAPCTAALDMCLDRPAQLAAMIGAIGGQGRKDSVRLSAGSEEGMVCAGALGVSQTGPAAADHPGAEPPVAENWGADLSAGDVRQLQRLFGAISQDECRYYLNGIALWRAAGGDVARKDCALFMWVVGSHLAESIELAAAWGFSFKTDAFYWMKQRMWDAWQLDLLTNDVPEPRMSFGYWTRKQVEPCLLFTRGSPKRLTKSVRQVIVEPRREHSRKPDCQYERIEALVSGPYLELFARNQRPGWASWGNQTDRFAPAESVA